MTNKETIECLKELNKSTKSYRYWLKRTSGDSYNRWPDNVYIDEKRSCALGLIEHYCERMNIDFNDWMNKL